MTPDNASLIESLLSLGLTHGATAEQIDEAYELARFVWRPDKFPICSVIRHDAEAELARIDAAYRELGPQESTAARTSGQAPLPFVSGEADRTSRVPAPEAAADSESKAARLASGSEPGGDITCPYCGSRLRVARPPVPGTRIRCGRVSCRQAFVMGEDGPIRWDTEAVRADLSEAQPFSPDDCDVSFDVVDVAIGDLPSEFTVISAYAKGDQRWTDAFNLDADQVLRRRLEGTGRFLFRVYRISRAGGETPSWATDLSVDDARTVAAEFEQTVVYFVRNGAPAVVSCGGTRAMSPLGRDRIRSRTQQRPDV